MYPLFISILDAAKWHPNGFVVGFTSVLVGWSRFCHPKTVFFSFFRRSSARSQSPKSGWWFYIYIYIYISAWWFGPFGLFFPFSWECQNPTDYIIFFRGGRVETTKQYWFDPHCWSPIFKSHGLTMKQWILPKNWAHFQGIETESFLIKSFSNPNSLRSTTISLYLTSSSSTNASTEGDL